jgi:hypothetical protein
MRASPAKKAGIDYQVLLSCIGLAVMAILFLYFKVIVPQHQAKVFSVFNTYMQQYASAGSDIVSAAAPQKPMKIIIISQTDTTDGSYSGDDLYFKLPDVMRAKNPDEVNTIVKIQRLSSSVGTYSNGSDAIQQSAHITVIDAKSNKAIADQYFEGSMPPGSVSGSGGGMGSSPDEEIIKYLESLNND